MFKVLKWPFVFMIIQLLIVFFYAFIFILQGYNINLFYLFLNKYQIFIVLTMALITIPILLKQYKEKKVKLNKPYFLILLGISISILGNIILFYLNKYFIFSNLYEANNRIILTLISTSIIGPIIEELMFRGLIYNTLKQKYSNTKSMLLTTILFSLLHFNLIQIIYTFVVGLILTKIYDKYKTIKAPLIVHIALNTATTLFTIILINNSLFNNIIIAFLSATSLYILKKCDIM